MAKDVLSRGGIWPTSATNVFVISKVTGVFLRSFVCSIPNHDATRKEATYPGFITLNKIY